MSQVQILSARLKASLVVADLHGVSDLSTERIELAWSPAQADYHEVALRSRRRPRRIVFGSALGLGLLLMVTGVLVRSGFAFGGGVGLWIYVLLLWLLVRRRGGSGFWKHDFLRSPKEATLSADAGLELRSAESTGTYTWSAFGTWEESEQLFVLRLRRTGRLPGAFILLPKRAFAGPADLDRARGMFRQRVEGVRRA
jgi:hypothetical protein